MSANRLNIVKEILETEKSYCNNLKALEEVYDKPLLSQTQWIDGQLHMKIFKDLNVIRSLNENLLKELQKSYEADRSNKKCDETIGDIFLKFAPFLKTYTSYTNNFESIAQSIQALKKKHKDLVEFLRQQQKNPAAMGNSLESFLIMPVQRIPRYNLLLRELLKNTSQYHKDYETLKKALDAMQEVASHVNEKIRELEAVNKMVEIKTQMEKELSKFEITKKFIIATRLYSFEVTGKKLLYIHSRKRKTWIPCAPKDKNEKGAAHLILFNDILLVCNNPNYHEQEKLKKEKNITDGSFEFPYDCLQLQDAVLFAPQSSDESTKVLLPWMMELDNNEEHKHAFMLITENDIFTLYFSNDEAKWDFMKSFSDLLDGALKRDPALKENRARFLDYTDVAVHDKKSKNISVLTPAHLPKFSSKKKLEEHKTLVNEKRIDQVRDMDDSSCIGFCIATASFNQPDNSLFQLAFFEGDVFQIYEKVKKGKKYWLVKKCGLNVSPTRRNQLLEGKLPENYKDMLAVFRGQQADKSREKWKKPAQLRKIEYHILKVDKRTDKEIKELSQDLDIASFLSEYKSDSKLSRKDRKSISAASFNQMMMDDKEPDDYVLHFLKKLTNVYSEKGEVGIVPSKFMIELPKVLDQKLIDLMLKRYELEVKKRRNFTTGSEKRRLTVTSGTDFIPSPQEGRKSGHRFSIFTRASSGSSDSPK